MARSATDKTYHPSLHDAAPGTGANACSSPTTSALPLVSAICPTYGRAPAHQHLLEEAIESFLRQTYPRKELLVLNDCPGQELVCDAPGVRIVNAPQRFASLGEKYNAAITMAQGALVAPWEDDDISLPWRLSLSVERLGDAAYFNPRCYWLLDAYGLHCDHLMGVGHNLSLFRRAAWQAVGGYPAISGAQDAQMDTALRASGLPIRDGHGRRAKREKPHQRACRLALDEWFYIYRWGVSPVHLSGVHAPEAYYRAVGEQPMPPGRFQLHPHWQADYVAMTRHVIESETPMAMILSRVRQHDEADVVPAFVSFPLLPRAEHESSQRHVRRVMDQLEAAIATGATLLILPPSAASWLAAHPQVAHQLRTAFRVTESNPDSSSVVIALDPRSSVPGRPKRTPN